MDQKKIKKRKALPLIGWREWVSLPKLKVGEIKAKIDTGARSSSLHAYDVKIIKKGQKRYVDFKIHPIQRNTKKFVQCRAPLLEFRKVKSSNGQTQVRPVIETVIEVLGESYPIELTLTNRDEMGFRMLLGRQTFKNKFLVDVGRSYYGKRKT